MNPKFLLLTFSGVLSISALHAQDGFESLPPEQQALIKEALAKGDEENRKTRLSGLVKSLQSHNENSQDVIAEMKALKELTLTNDETSEVYAPLLKSPSSWVYQIALEHLSELPREHPALEKKKQTIFAAISF